MQNFTLSITQLNNYIKNIFDNEELLIGVSVYGEVTNFKISNGIAYFDIKEEGAQLSCVKFSSYVPFAKNGDQVIVTGKLNYHVKLGRLSFVVSKVEPYGMGELYKKYLELKARLESEGLFDSSKKVEIPKYANTIGVVTSETGAVIRDIYHVTRKKNPFTNIIVYPVKVQGVNAEKEIAQGVNYFSNSKNVDVVIVARGGGSFEDLSPFNTEEVARAVFASNVPVISAVGHETDFTIIDFVSDFRAPTPSVAAEVAVFNYFEEIEYLDNLKNSISKKVDKLLIDKKQGLLNFEQLINKTINSKLSLAGQSLTSLKELITKSMLDYVEDKQYKLTNLVTKLEKSNPLTILKAGYAKVLLNNKPLKISDVKVGDILETCVENGVVVSKVENVKENKKWVTKRLLKN